MSKKQKIIVSITGIVLVSLILIGLTYAYFLVVITGNTNTKSISVSTANLVLEYGENTNVVQGINNAEPGYSVEKIFTATNKGNSTVTYGAALESIVNGLTRQEDLVYTLTCTSYLKEGFSLASDGTITGTVDGTCSGVTTEKQFPSTSAISIMTTNTIDTTHTHAYKLTITYKEMNVDQSEDMGKTFSSKVNIVDLRASADNINPYSSNKNALNYQIVNSALEGGTNRTTYGSEVTTFTSISGENERVLNTAPDDYGTSYYFRGNVLDNYVTFANKTWRIVRINGDGSIRLVLDDNISSIFNEYDNGVNLTSTLEENENVSAQFLPSNNTKKYDIKYTAPVPGGDINADNVYVGYMYGSAGSTTYKGTHANENDSVIKTNVDAWYKTNIIDTNNSDYVSDTLFCNDKTLASNGIGGLATQLGYGTNDTYYSSIERLEYSVGKTSITTSKPTFKCAESATDTYSRFTVNTITLSNGNQTNGDLKYPVGLLTADEVAYAGAYKYGQSNKTYYLYNSNITFDWWLSTPSAVDTSVVNEWIVEGKTGSLSSRYVYNSISFRPTINLKASVLISGGNGTKENPYKIAS